MITLPNSTHEIAKVTRNRHEQRCWLVIIASLAVTMTRCDFFPTSGPCPAHNGSVNGYCDGDHAVNCSNSGCGAGCGADAWASIQCPIGDTCIVSARETMRQAYSSPVLSHPTLFANCSSWLPPTDGGTDGSQVDSLTSD